MIDPSVDLNIKNILCRMQKRTGRVVLKPKESQIIDELKQAANADLFGIYLFDEKLSPYSHVATNHYEGFLNHYEEYRSFDPILHNVLRHGSVTEASEVLGASGWERHPLCQFMAHWRLGHTMQAPLISGGEIVGTINIARDQNRGRFIGQEASWIWNISQIVSHLLEKNTTPVQISRQSVLKSKEQNNLVIESDGCGQIISETGEGTVCEEGSTFGLIIQQSIEANLKKITTTECVVATRKINTPPPDIEQILITTTAVPSCDDRYLTTVIGLSALTPQTQLDLELLPPKTKRVAKYLLRGYSNKMIAQELGISENTVKDHVRKIYSRYGAHNKAEFAWLVNSPLKIC
jgi:DNA-binding CsgD family transcriptional regulator